MSFFNCYNLLLYFSTGQLAIDLARDEQMKQVLAVRPIRQVQRSVKRHEGQLLKVSKS